MINSISVITAQTIAVVQIVYRNQKSRSMLYLTIFAERLL